MNMSIKDKAALGRANTKKEQKDLEKKLGDLKISSISRLLKEDDVKGKPHARTRSEKIKDMFKNVELGAGAKSAISRLLKNFKRNISDVGTEQPTSPVKKFRSGGSVKKKKNKMATTKGWGASRKT
mgnify:CR=1 FL=1